MTIPRATLLSLVVREAQDAIFDFGIGIATALGLPTTAWQTGSPERSLYQILAAKLYALEENRAGYIESGFLDFASGTWLTILADQLFGYTRPEATYATTDIVLTNSVGGLYTIDPGDLTVKASSTGKTYRNTSQVGSVTLAAAIGSTLTIEVVAEESGGGSSAGVGEINTVVVGPAGSTCTNAAAAVGTDAESDVATRTACRAKQDMISPLGARFSPGYVCRLAEYGGTPAITRTRTFGSTTTGTFTTYVASASGGSPAADVALALEAITNWATPICMTPVVAAASNVTVAVTYEMWIYKSCGKTATEIRAKVSSDLLAMFASRPIGGDVIPPATTGSLYHSMIESTIRAAFPSTCFRVVLSTPSGDTALTNSQVPALGTVTGTINLIPDPV